MTRTTIELTTRAAVEQHLNAHSDADKSLVGVVIQDVDLRPLEPLLTQRSWEGATLLGCHLSTSEQQRAIADGALLFPRFEELPFSPYRGCLYRVDELYERFEPTQPDSYHQCLDARVYHHWKTNGGAHAEHIMETLARRLHDHAITDALEEFLRGEGKPRQVVAIMGGHSMARSHRDYVKVARIARELTQKGYLMASGGGPGAMEATHLGAWFVRRSEAEFNKAIEILSEAPSYKHPRWLAAAFHVREEFPLADGLAQEFPSLGIPTWLYGHEPPNAFATHIAKYFANSVREDGLLAIAKHGIIYSPGSAGTIQEVFQDACQNHYLTAGVISPMIFLGREYWTQTKPVYPLLKSLAQGKDYGRWLSITDDAAEAVARLLEYRASSDAPAVPA